MYRRQSYILVHLDLDFRRNLGVGVPQAPVVDDVAVDFAHAGRPLDDRVVRRLVPAANPRDAGEEACTRRWCEETAT